MPLSTLDQERARKNLALSAVGAREKTDGVTLTLESPTRAVWVGTGGTLICMFADGSSATLLNVPDSYLMPVAVVSIAGTATGVVALL